MKSEIKLSLKVISICCSLFLLFHSCIGKKSSKVDDIDKIVNEVEKRLDGNLTYEATIGGANPMPPITFYYDGSVSPYTGGLITLLAYEEFSKKSIKFSTYEVIDKSKKQIVFHDHYYLEKVLEKREFSQKFLLDVQRGTFDKASGAVDTTLISQEVLEQLSLLIEPVEIALKFEGVRMEKNNGRMLGEIIYRTPDSNQIFVTFDLDKENSSVVGFGMNP